MIPPPRPLFINPVRKSHLHVRTILTKPKDDIDGDTIIWKDPTTGETFVVDTRTGNSYPQETPLINGHEQGVKRRTLQASEWLKKDKDPCSIEDVAEDNRTMPNWLQQALGVRGVSISFSANLMHRIQANETYPLTESKIPSLSLSSTFTNEIQESGFSDHNHHACSRNQNTSHYFQTGPTSAESKPPSRRFRKEDLSNAQIISQVDRKFIACLIQDDTTISDNRVSSRALVLIDQHAADERVRVERFLKELCLGFLQHSDTNNGVKMKELSPSVPVLLTRHEALRLADSGVFQGAFECWGIMFDDLSSLSSHSIDGGLDTTRGEGYVQVFVRSIPAIVSEKVCLLCIKTKSSENITSWQLLMGDELRDLIKGFLAKLEEDGSTFSLACSQKTIHEGANDDPFSWLKALRWCPRELLDLINSKACRGMRLH